MPCGHENVVTFSSGQENVVTFSSGQEPVVTALNNKTHRNCACRLVWDSPYNRLRLNTFNPTGFLAWYEE